MSTATWQASSIFEADYFEPSNQKHPAYGCRVFFLESLDEVLTYKSKIALIPKVFDLQGENY